MQEWVGRLRIDFGIDVPDLLYDNGSDASLLELVKAMGDQPGCEKYQQDVGDLEQLGDINLLRKVSAGRW